MGYDQQFESWVCLEILLFIVFKWSGFLHWKTRWDLGVSPFSDCYPGFGGQRWKTPKIMGWRENVMMKEITLNMYAGERFRSEGYNWYNILIISSGVWKRCVCIMADWIVMCSPPFWNERCPKGGNKWLWATRQLVNLHKTGHAARRVDILSCCIFRYQLLILWDKANTTPAFPQVVIDLWSPVSSLQSFLMTMLAMIYMISPFLHILWILCALIQGPVDVSLPGLWTSPSKCFSIGDVPPKRWCFINHHFSIINDLPVFLIDTRMAWWWNPHQMILP